MTGLRLLADRCVGAVRAWTPAGVLSVSVYLVVQVLGVLMSFVTILFVARWGGSAQQGVFFTYKTVSDFLAATLLFGMPQAYIYLINKGRISISALSAFSAVYWLVSFVICAAVLCLYWMAGLLPTSDHVLSVVLLLCAGVSGYVMHGLARGVILTNSRASTFSLFSVAPSVLLLGLIAIQFFWFSLDFPAAIGATGFISGVVGAIWLSSIASPNFSALMSIPYRTLVLQSLHTFVQSSIYAAQPALTLTLLRMEGALDRDIGNFSIAVTAFAAINAAVALIAPVLFNRWSKALTWSQYGPLARRTYIAAAALMVVAIGVMAFAGPVLTALLGSGYNDAIQPVQIMALAVFPILSTRFLSSAIYALGHPGVNTASCVVRLTAVGGSFLLFRMVFGDLLVAASFSWVVGEWLAFMAQTALIRKARGAATEPRTQ